MQRGIEVRVKNDPEKVLLTATAALRARIYAPDVEKMKTWETPKAERVP